MNTNATELLALWRTGNREALDALFPLVYEDLRLRAHRLLEGQPAGLALAARAMRMVLVSYARAHGAEKRGGGNLALELDDSLMLPADRAGQMVALDDALERLARLNERLSRTVELRFFGGLTIEESAEALGVAPSTVKLDWQKARAWLYRELHGE